MKNEILDETQIAFVDDAANNGKSRPDTKSTIRAAIREVITSAENGKLEIKDGAYKIAMQQSTLRG